MTNSSYQNAIGESSSRQSLDSTSSDSLLGYIGTVYVAVILLFLSYQLNVL